MLNDNRDSSSQQFNDGDDTTAAAAVAVDLQNCDTMDDSGQMIQLPSIGINTDRTISGVCTICLCPYEDGDQISWSTEESCQHAFHTDCIIPWLAKKEEPKCPICRQEFCATPNVSHMEDSAFDFDLERENSFLHSFSQALAMSQLYRPYPSESSNSYEQTRNAITLQLATLALENQVRLEQQSAVATPMSSTANAPAAVNTGSGSNMAISTFPRRNSSRIIGDGSATNATTAATTAPPSSTENPISMTGDTTNDTTTSTNTTSDTAPIP